MSAEPTLRWGCRPAGLASAHAYLFFPGASADFPGGVVGLLACPGGVFLVATGAGVVVAGAAGAMTTLVTGASMEAVDAGELTPLAELLGLAADDFPAGAPVDGFVDGLTGILNTMSALPPAFAVGFGVGA